MEGGGGETSILASCLTNGAVFGPESLINRTVIGRGKDSVILSATCTALGDAPVAVKQYQKGRLSASKIRAIKREAAMMATMTRKQVPGVTRLYHAFQDANTFWLVMELGQGGDLLERLLSEGKAMTEQAVCSSVAIPILETLAVLHDMFIIHRDLKLENIFLNADGTVLLGDFGLTMSSKQELAISPVGTVEYMAPESISKQELAAPPVGTVEDVAPEVVALPPVEAVTSGLVRACDIKPCTDRVDIWALGVTLYELLTGHLPFEGKDKADVKAAITAGRLRALPHHLSPECCDFVNSMLEPQPSKRPGAAQLLAHPYVLRSMGEHIPAQPKPGPPPRTLSSRGDSVSSTMDRDWSSQAVISKQVDMHLQSQGSSDSLIGARHVPALVLDGARAGSSPLGSSNHLTHSQTARQQTAKHSPRVVEARQKRQMSADHCSVHVHASASTETPAWGIGKVSAYFRGLFVQAS